MAVQYGSEYMSQRNYECVERFKGGWTSAFDDMCFGQPFNVICIAQINQHVHDE
jgi:hypothetical protein